ncbi:MAG: hypothetical protein ACRD4E_02390 [Bryobacteraceae bacterium]
MNFFREARRSDDVMEASRATMLQANLEADRGNLAVARELLRNGILKDRATGVDGFAAQKTIALAYLEGISGNRGSAVAKARDAVFIRRSPQVLVQAVSILARFGTPEDAAALMNTVPAREGPKYEADKLRMRGEILLAKGNFKDAVDLLTRAAQLDRPEEPKEYLARALDMAGDRQGARLIYQRIVDTSFLTWITDEEQPATRFRAMEYLKTTKGE